MVTTNTTDLEAILARPYPFAVSALPHGGWGITFVDLPGCVAQADSWEEIGIAARDAFEGWVESEWRRGHPIPEPSLGWEPVTFDEVDLRVEPVLSPEEVANRLNISRRRLNQLAVERGIGQHVGSTRVYHPSDIDRLQERRPAGRPRHGD